MTHIDMKLIRNKLNLVPRPKDSFFLNNMFNDVNNNAVKLIFKVYA